MASRMQARTGAGRHAGYGNRKGFSSALRTDAPRRKRALKAEFASAAYSMCA